MNRAELRHRWRAVLRVTALVGGLISAVVLAVVCVLNLSLGSELMARPPERLYSVKDPQFSRSIGAVMTPDLVPAMRGALKSARRSITFETYIFSSSSIASEFEQAFGDAARRGVEVKVLLDWIGCELHEDNVDRMRAVGVEVQLYNPPRWFSAGRFNNRTHRKLMVVDGRLGFIGGVDIADDWRGHAQGPDHWRGTHFQVEGPVVAQIQSAFIDNWLRTSGEALHGDAFLPALHAVGSMPAHVFMSSPRGGAKGMQLLYLMSIASASRTIDLSAAYFVPDAVARRALIEPSAPSCERTEQACGASGWNRL